MILYSVVYTLLEIQKTQVVCHISFLFVPVAMELWPLKIWLIYNLI